ncbi:MAG: ferrous iron transport protein B [Bacteroidales bacterium]|nr:ferrous iron transport protein B [Bacteroidales bacterium]
MYLSDLATGEKAVIVRVNGHGSFRKRLIEMGFIQGKKVTVVLNAPLKDPIEYEILGYKVSLRREEARRIEVISQEEARQADAGEDLGPLVEGFEDEEQRLDAMMERLAAERNHVIRVALVGNPNCGKTSLFNAASGAHEHVGNYSGVTVDAKEGKLEYKGYRITLVDLPGTYSLSAYSPEELYVRKNLIDALPDVVVNVVDASNLERNLYLTTQIIDMNLRVVMALNMYDELRASGDSLDMKQLSWLLGIPVCPTVSRTGEGVNDLFDTIIKIYEGGDQRLARHIHINHGAELEKSIDRIKVLLQENPELRDRYSTRYLAIKYLENDKDIEGLVDRLPNREDIVSARTEEEARIESLLHENTENAIVDAKYAFIQGALAETYKPHQEYRARRTVTDRIDAVVTNKWLAFPIFILLLYIIFYATFTLGNYPMDWIDWLVGNFGEGVGALMNEGWLKDLVVDGIIAGVGSVLVFLPNILILYFFISLMEDSGYMARAAFIVDKLMHRIGLHGKSFIPMVMGFGCNVPAIMATRTIESRKSRLITIAILPFMSCAGRLPIFVLLAGAFFPRHAPLALLGIYLLGIVLAIISALIFAKFVRDDDLPFVMELPPYRVPTSKAIGRHTWEKGRQYLQKMATTILIGSVIIWCLGYFPRSDKGAGYQQEHSYIGQVGKAVAPALDPLGFDWKMDIGLLTGVVAKELVVSTLGVMYAPEAETAQSEAALSDAAETAAGAGDTDTALQAALVKTVSLPAAVAFMVFVLLYFPCIATFVAIKNETGKWGWAIAICAYTMVVAWVFAFIAFRLTSLLI